MKKLVLVFGITLAFSTTGTAFDIAISTQVGWFGQAAADREMQEIVDRVKGVEIERFTATDHAALADWVKDHTGDGISDLLILCGQFPSTIYAPGNTQANGSIAELFLDDGNCIINTGDYMFYVVDGAGTNAEPGLETMMDIAHIAMWDDDTAIVVTADGKKYAPTLVDYASDRPWHLDELRGDWYAELILGQNAAGTRAEPVIITNRVTGGRLGTFYQTASQDNDPRGEVMSEWINSWYIPKFGGPNPLARRPNPRKESMIDVTWLEVSWKAGDFAKQHDVYFGESFEEVSTATRDHATVFVGTQAGTKLIMGLAGGVAPGGLVPGKTYYWRVDEISDGRPGSPWKGPVWSFTVRPTNAWQPAPTNGTRNVDPNQDLSWNYGIGSIFHTVFFGENFDEVANAPFGMMSTQTTYDPGTLKLDTTYYWRIDEFAFPANKTYKGDVWSFTTLGKDAGVKADYFAGMALAGDPILSQIEPAIDHSWGEGAIAGDLIDLVSARWRANLEAPSTETYTLITSTDDGVRLRFDGRLVIDEWIDQGTTDWTAQVDLIAGQIYSIVMEWYENGGGAVAQLFWSSPTLARQIIPQGWLQLPFQASCMYPANGAADVPQAPMLRWIPGDKAASQEIYFGQDKDAVTAATTPTASLAADETTYDPGTLEWGKTYYWRVDEVNAAEADSPWKSVTWSFTTAAFLIVDDFESYANDSPNRVFQTWIDGWGFSADEFFPDGNAGNGTGAMIGYDPGLGNVMETSIVHGGFQSMPFDYNNVDLPYYSEGIRTWNTAQNWTVNGMNTLTIHVQGQASNGPAVLYVTLKDSTGKTATVRRVGGVEYPADPVQSSQSDEDQGDDDRRGQPGPTDTRRRRPDLHRRRPRDQAVTKITR
jgi:hypothetical protein